MDNQDIASLLMGKIDEAINVDGGPESKKRIKAQKSYRGDPNGYEREGYSEYTTRECMENEEWVKPGLVRLFLGQDKIFTFSGRNAEDDDQAKQETSYVHHLVQNTEDSYTQVVSWLTDTLRNDVGYFKAHSEEKTKRSVVHYTGLDERALAVLLSDENITPLEQEARPGMVAQIVGIDQQGQPIHQSVPGTVYDIKVRKSEKKKRLCLESIPGDQCLIEKGYSKLDLDDCPFVAHFIKDRTVTEWADLGYSLEFLNNCSSNSDIDKDQEKQNRDKTPANRWDSKPFDDSMRELDGYECYVRMDYDGDGIAELRKIMLIGDKIAIKDDGEEDNEEINEQPMISMVSIIDPHKHGGISWQTLSEDIQLLSTQLNRGVLDNITRMNALRKGFDYNSLVHEGGLTLQAMDNPDTEWIPFEGPPAWQVEPSQSMLGEILPVIQYYSDAKAVRTGVSPETSIDPNVLKDATAGAFKSALENVAQRQELLARNMAQTGFAKLGLKIHAIARQNWDVEDTIRIRNEWVEIKPQEWEERTDLKINVGTGRNSKETQMFILDSIMQKQLEAGNMGLADAKKGYAALEQWVDLSGAGEPEEFFINPEKPVGVDPQSGEPIPWQAPQPGPDPNVIAAESQQQALLDKSDLEKRKFNFELQQKEAQEMREAREAEMQHELDIKKLQSADLDREIKREELRLAQLELLAAQPELEAKAAKVDAETDEIIIDTMTKERDLANPVGNGAETS